MCEYTCVRVCQMSHVNFATNANYRSLKNLLRCGQKTKEPGKKNTETTDII